MTDQEFISKFENLTFPADEFHHEQHIHLAWIYLQTMALPEAMIRFRDSLKAFAANIGKANLYHETITFAFMMIIQDRIEKSESISWQEFKSENADLFDWKNNVLLKFYKKETLASDRAKKVFVFPDFN